MTIYDRVKALCKENNVKIGQMEKDLGISRGSAYRWNTSKPNSATLIKLSEYFGIDPAYITDGLMDAAAPDIEAELKQTIIHLKDTSLTVTFNTHILDEKTRQVLTARLENVIDVTNINLT